MQTLVEKQCPYCTHNWVLRKTNPLRCPNCGRKLTKQKSAPAEQEKEKIAAE